MKIICRFFSLRAVAQLHAGSSLGAGFVTITMSNDPFSPLYYPKFVYILNNSVRALRIGTFAEMGFPYQYIPNLLPYFKRKDTETYRLFLFNNSMYEKIYWDGVGAIAVGIQVEIGRAHV